MKVLTTIKSTGRPEEMAHTTFRWAARAGFDIAIFVPKREVDKYKAAVDDANYHYYLVGRDENKIVINGTTPMRYAKKHGYGLIVELPDNMLDYSEPENDDKGVLDYAAEVGIARKAFSTETDRVDYILKPDCIVKRVK